MKYWKRVDAYGLTTTVESYSHDSVIKKAIEITKSEFDDFLASLPEPELNPSRDAFAELDDHERRIEALEKEA